MNDESEGSVDGVVRSILDSVRAQLASMTAGANLAWAEMRVVAGHAGLLVGLVVIAAGIALVGWGLILLLVALVLVGAGFSAIQAIASVVVVNLLGLVGVGLFIRHTLKAISFRHTRRALGIQVKDVNPSG